MLLHGMRGEGRVLRPVANLTRRDGEEFLALVPRVPVRAETRHHPLERANGALAALVIGDTRGERRGEMLAASTVRGAAVPVSGDTPVDRTT